MLLVLVNNTSVNNKILKVGRSRPGAGEEILVEKNRDSCHTSKGLKTGFGNSWVISSKKSTVGAFAGVPHTVTYIDQDRDCHV